VAELTRPKGSNLNARLQQGIGIMPENRNIQDVRQLASEIAEENGRMRGLVAKSLEVPKTPVADTFLGRQHHQLIALTEEGALPSDFAAPR
jgi:hypothetical protein